MDQTIDSELQNFKESFRKRSNAALNTIENDLETRAQLLSRTLHRRWLPPLILGLSLSIGIFSGSWATMQYLASNIRNLMQEARSLDMEIDRQQQTLDILQERTGGINLSRGPNGTFITIPDGMTLDPNWKLNGGPAWRLSAD